MARCGTASAPLPVRRRSSVFEQNEPTSIPAQVATTPLDEAQAIAAALKSGAPNSPNWLSH